METIGIVPQAPRIGLFSHESPGTSQRMFGISFYFDVSKLQDETGDSKVKCLSQAEFETMAAAGLLLSKDYVVVVRIDSTDGFPFRTVTVKNIGMKKTRGPAEFCDVVIVSAPVDWTRIGIEEWAGNCRSIYTASGQIMGNLFAEVTVRDAQYAVL